MAKSSREALRIADFFLILHRNNVQESLYNPFRYDKQRTYQT